jgi:hypothetical protein
MLASNANRRTTGDAAARDTSDLGGSIVPTNSQTEFFPQAVRAELIGDNECRCAGIVTRSTSPVLAMCQKLIVVGVDPDLRMEVFRGTTLCLRVASIGAASRLELNGHGSGFRTLRGGGAGLPVRKSPPIEPQLPPSLKIKRGGP